MSVERTKVEWPCFWCRHLVAFEVDLGPTFTLPRREASCADCGARLGFELHHAADGYKLHVKRLAQGRAGRLDIAQVDDALTVSLAQRPLAEGAAIEVRLDGSWQLAAFHWDSSGEGAATITVAGVEHSIDPVGTILRWTAP